MEREILFRGREKRDTEWFEGDLSYLVHDKEACYIFPPDGYNSADCYEVDPATVGQYTGLTDKNGKKVFENDILKIGMVLDGMGEYYFPPIDYPVNVVVKWDMCAWMWETATGPKYYIHFPEAWSHYEFEVIGNITDNPELLEAKREHE